MTFRPKLARAVMAGRKTVTRRPVSDNPRSPYSEERAPTMVGKLLAICPGRGKDRIGRCMVIGVRRERFDPRTLRLGGALAEGFDSTEAFLETWERLHGNLDPVDVWRIEFAPETAVAA